jgi:hypothetical protein
MRLVKSKYATKNATSIATEAKADSNLLLNDEEFLLIF